MEIPFSQITYLEKQTALYINKLQQENNSINSNSDKLSTVNPDPNKGTNSSDTENNIKTETDCNNLLENNTSDPDIKSV